MQAGRLLGRRAFVAGAGIALATGAAMLSGCSGGSKSDSGSNASSSEAKKSVEITDQLGKTIAFDTIPTRVATTIIPFPSIYYAIMGDTDTLIGANPASMPAYENSVLKSMYPTLAGVNTDWCARDFTVNVEQLLSLKPDVVFQWTSQPDSIKAMEDAGLKVVALKYGTVDDLETWIRLLGRLFDKDDRADFIVDYFFKQVDEVSSRTSGLGPEQRPTSIHLSENLTVNGSGFTPYWMDKSGANDPAADMQQQSVKVDMEQIISWNPDYVFVGNFTGIKASDVLQNKLDGQDWSQIKAVQNNNVYKIPIGGYRWDPPCVETPLMIKWLAKVQHADLFEDMDMKAEVSTFYSDVYGYGLSDDELSRMLDHTQD
ncbi:ABC transporter substrate-binding protein [Curtanaerobium respiraculi]|uniref:ABC transporter substrate-binding protein n=1 Tax=Curtanaerobium respiraculi TaxID=2949669 RepID=UPI0024B342E5|nr:ABC transporter substrate-binding protein [Curtanaerobium respiraculi]